MPSQSYSAQHSSAPTGRADTADALVAIGIVGTDDAAEQLDAQQTAVGVAQGQFADLRVDVSACFRIAEDLAEKEAEERDLEQERNTAAEAHTEATKAAAAAQAGYDTAEESLGEDARAKAKQQAELGERIKDTKSELEKARRDRDEVIQDRSTAEANLAKQEEEKAELAQARDDKRQALGTVLSAGFGMIAVGVDLALPKHPTYEGTLRIAQDLISRIDDPGDRASLRTDLQTAFSDLVRTEAGARNHMREPDGMCQVLVPTVDAGDVDVTVRARQIAQQTAETSELLSTETRRLIDGFLLDQVAEHLVDRVSAAFQLVSAMNDTLKKRMRPGRQSLEFRLVPSKDLLDLDRDAVELLRRDIISGDDRATVAGFLERRIQDARADDTGDLETRLRDALDYRRWFTFLISVVNPDGTVRKLSSATQSSGSGGSRDRILALALFATVSAFYDSTRDRQSPRLVMLDEAFSKVSSDNVRDCLALARDLDLDWYFTSYDKWFTYAEVPGLAIYHYRRDNVTGTVTPVRFVWDGIQKRPDDPWRQQL